MVLAIGNPFGVGQTVTHGIVSALARTQVGITDYQFFIQTDAAINPGNSGGALVDLSGRLVGINTAIFSRSGGSQGIGFAIPVNMVQVVAASARGGGSAVKRPWLGAKLQGMTPEIAEGLGIKRTSGALVASVCRQFAGRQGRPEDRRRDRRDRRPVGRGPERLRLSLRHPTAGRAGAARVAARRARERASWWRCNRAPERPREEVVIKARSPLDRRQGRKSFARARRRIAARCRRPKAWWCWRSRKGSPAHRLGFQRGDIVVSINEQNVATSKELERATGNAQRMWQITIMRGGRQVSAQFGG